VTGPGPDDLRLNPDSAHPPFAWRVALPESWAVLDTHPATWQRSLQPLVDERLAGQRLPAADRRQIVRHLEDLVGSAQRGGVLLSLVFIGLLDADTPISAGLHIAWYDSSPEPASLTTARRAAGRQGIVEEVDSPAGTLVVQRDHLMVAAPGSAARQGLTSLQAFLPLPGLTWTALVATASPHPETTDMLRELVITVAGSIEPVREPAAHPAPGTRPPAYRATRTPDAPGVDKGFGTMVVRRVDPGADAAVHDRDDPATGEPEGG